MLLQHNHKGMESRYLLRDGNLSSISTNFFQSPCAHVNGTRKCTPTWYGAAPPHPRFRSHIQKKATEPEGREHERGNYASTSLTTTSAGQFSYYTMSFRSYFRCNLLISICFFFNRTCATLLAADCFLLSPRQLGLVRGSMMMKTLQAILGRKKAGQGR